MAVTEVSICNEALTALGENTIVALTDSNKAARLCNLKYEGKRDYLLRRYHWNFAAKRAELTPEVVAPAFEFSAEFLLPDDCIQLRELYPNNISYRLEGLSILCDEATLSIKYTYKVTDPTKMDATFVETLAALLAREMAIALTDSTTKHSQMDELYEVKLSEARFAGSIEDDMHAIEADDWIESRY